MKVGIESQRIFRSSKHGMDVVAVELIREIQLQDTVNQYLLFAKDGPDKDCVRASATLDIRILPGISYADWEQISLPRAIKKANLSLLHCTANTAPLRCSVPLVLTLHDIIFLQNVNFKGSGYQNFGNLYRKMVVPPAIKKAAKIITVSEFEKTVIAEWCKIDPDRIIVIHNAVTEKFRQIDDANVMKNFRAKYKLPERYILHLGNTAPKKNTQRVIKAYAEYCSEMNEPLPMVIADYPSSLVNGILKEINREDLAGKIYLPGYVPVGEMPLLYNGAGLFLYPSLNESFGLPMLEAMACGIPVIASGIAALEEVAGDAAIFVDPEDTKKIAAAIHAVLSSKQLQETLVHSGFARARQFSWKKAAEKLINVYQSVSG